MKGRTLPILLFALACAGIPAFFTLCQKMTWVGSTDVAIQFVVTDAETGVPIPNAVIRVHAETGGFCEECDEREFKVQTDQSGTGTHVCKRCMCYGSESVFENTFGVHLPEWCYRAKASGYAASDLEFLGTEEHHKSVRRSKPNATVTVPVRLSKHRTTD